MKIDKKLQQKIDEAFKLNKTEALYVLADGTIFTAEAKNLAMDYARKKGLKWAHIEKNTKDKQLSETCDDTGKDGGGTKKDENTGKDTGKGGQTTKKADEPESKDTGKDGGGTKKDETNGKNK